MREKETVLTLVRLVCDQLLIVLQREDSVAESPVESDGFCVRSCCCKALTGSSVFLIPHEVAMEGMSRVIEDVADEALIFFFEDVVGTMFGW